MKNTDIMDRLYDLSQESPSKRYEAEIDRTRDNLKKIMKDPKIEEDILDYGIAYERKGFEAGFAMAFQIVSQCISLSFGS